MRIYVCSTVEVFWKIYLITILRNLKEYGTLWLLVLIWELSESKHDIESLVMFAKMAKGRDQILEEETMRTWSCVHVREEASTSSAY